MDCEFFSILLKHVGNVISVSSICMTVSLKANFSYENIMSKNIFYQMHPTKDLTNSLETGDCLDWFIKIFKYASERSIWDGLLLAMK